MLSSVDVPETLRVSRMFRTFKIVHLHESTLNLSKYPSYLDYIMHKIIKCKDWHSPMTQVLEEYNEAILITDAHYNIIICVSQNKSSKQQ